MIVFDNLVQNIAPHFLLYEFLISDSRSPFYNALNLNAFFSSEGKEIILSNIKNVGSILEEIREDYGQPIIVTSGFRCPSVNSYYKGSKNSYHLSGRAVDIKYSSHLAQICTTFRDRLKELIINKQKGYIHIAI